MILNFQAFKIMERKYAELAKKYNDLKHQRTKKHRIEEWILNDIQNLKI